MATTNKPLSIPHTITSLDEAPAPLRPFFQATDDGKFVLQVEGHPAEAKLTQFRENNRTLHARAEELESKLKAYGDTTPETVAQLRDRLALFADLDPAAARAALADAERLKGETQTHGTTAAKLTAES